MCSFKNIEYNSTYTCTKTLKNRAFDYFPSKNCSHLKADKRTDCYRGDARPARRSCGSFYPFCKCPQYVNGCYTYPASCPSASGSVTSSLATTIAHSTFGVFHPGMNPGIQTNPPSTSGTSGTAQTQAHFNIPSSYSTNSATSPTHPTSPSTSVQTPAPSSSPSAQGSGSSSAGNHDLVCPPLPSCPDATKITYDDNNCAICSSAGNHNRPISNTNGCPPVSMPMKDCHIDRNGCMLCQGSIITTTTPLTSPTTTQTSTQSTTIKSTTRPTTPTPFTTKQTTTRPTTPTPISTKSTSPTTYTITAAKTTTQQSAISASSATSPTTPSTSTTTTKNSLAATTASTTTGSSAATTTSTTTVTSAATTSTTSGSSAATTAATTSGSSAATTASITAGSSTATPGNTAPHGSSATNGSTIVMAPPTFTTIHIPAVTTACPQMQCLLDCGSPPKFMKDTKGCDLCQCDLSP
ncbi:integumentary mucin C.1-like isoform X1 [Dreissena polymorpha]|nr:integumentary mucin C.1-like isoform X1 [Dreissena polymorpha]